MSERLIPWSRRYALAIPLRNHNADLRCVCTGPGSGRRLLSGSAYTVGHPGQRSSAGDRVAPDSGDTIEISGLGGANMQGLRGPPAMHRSSLPSTTAASARPPGDGPNPPPARRPSASNGLAPTDNGAAASALTRYLTEDHDRIAQSINDVTIRRIFAAGLDLQAALELIVEHRAASKIWHAIGELDQAVTDIRDTIFDCNRATHGPDLYVSPARDMRGMSLSWLLGSTPSPQVTGGSACTKTRKAAGQDAQRLTDLLTRPAGTGETTRDTGDTQRGLRLVSETRRNAGDGGRRASYGS